MPLSLHAISKYQDPHVTTPDSLLEALQRIHDATLAGREALITFHGEVLSGSGLILRIDNRDWLAGKSTGPMLLLQFFAPTQDDSAHHRFCDSPMHAKFGLCPESTKVVVIGWGDELGAYCTPLGADVRRDAESIERLVADLCSLVGENSPGWEFALEETSEGNQEDLEADDEENWSDDDEEEEQSQSVCPLCGEEDSCNHLLLLIDHTFQTLEGGVLYDDIDKVRGRFWEVLEAEPNESVKQAFQSAGLDFDKWRSAVEQGEFESMFLNFVQEVVGNHADADSEYEVDDSPGQGSAYLAYWSESADQSRAQIRKELLDPVGG